MLVNRSLRPVLIETRVNLIPEIFFQIRYLAVVSNRSCLSVRVEAPRRTQCCAGLVGGHFCLRPLHDFVSHLLELRNTVLQDNQRLYRFAAPRMRRAYDAAFSHMRITVHHRFDFGRPDLEAGSVDHAFEPVGKKEVAIRVDPPPRSPVRNQDFPSMSTKASRVASGLFQ